MFYVIKIKGECDMSEMTTSKKIRKYAPPVAGLIIFGFGGFATAGLTFGAVIVIGSFICSMCLGSLFAAVGVAATVATSISIHKTHKDIAAKEVLIEDPFEDPSDQGRSQLLFN
jgi:hypothetical protein